MTTKPLPDFEAQAETLRARLAEAEEMLRAIQQGEIDALVVEGVGGNKIYTLHGAEEPYRNLVEQMQEGAAVLTRTGDILYANLHFAELVGEPLESVVASRFDRFVSPPDREAFETMLQAGSGKTACLALFINTAPCLCYGRFGKIGCKHLYF